MVKGVKKMILYSTGCPMCKVLEEQLKLKGLTYTKIDDIEKIKKKGFQSVPVLECEDGTYIGSEAMKYVIAK